MSAVFLCATVFEHQSSASGMRGLSVLQYVRENGGKDFTWWQRTKNGFL